MAWTATLVRLVTGDHATWDRIVSRFDGILRVVGSAGPITVWRAQILPAFITLQEACPASSGRKRHLYTRPAIVLKGE